MKDPTKVTFHQKLSIRILLIKIYLLWNDGISTEDLKNEIHLMEYALEAHIFFFFKRHVQVLN